jgi:hypothetical protein
MHLPLPATTLSSLTTLSNNDLVVGSLTRDEILFASPDEQKAL